MSRINFHDPKEVRGIEVRLYFSFGQIVLMLTVISECPGALYTGVVWPRSSLLGQ